jgi:hypothetical protein
MIGFCDRRLRRFATALAGLAVYLQLAFASWGLLTTAADPAEALAGHALCFAADSDAARTPPDTGPVAPAHHHFAFCCLWHSLPGVTPQAALTPLPVTYAAVSLDTRNAAVFRPGPHRGQAKARAPPPV